MTKSRPVPHYARNEVTSIKSDKPELLASPEVANITIKPGEEQNIKLVICDAKSRIKINGARVSGMIVSPGGTPARLEHDVTDENGQISYTWAIPDNSEPGIYTVTLDTVANGYRPSVTKITFQVI